ncbi:hypothetical protein APY04_0180 [Hyphomicrobium sulfonivorans]|uniref:Uncharacterized protein n=1 Tax=Hyphomicrobium sulfonivorans TaxID=121290 RepID=A0A109BP37_HYPSL|nr:hypothetical protein [Hyphomicrobium sulfonivorans]KWT72386.1 hypothetical protein APY04_0180 [Hyphomicrobium sulfonivorans]
MQIAFEFSHKFHDPVMFARFSEGFAALVTKFISGAGNSPRAEDAVPTSRGPVAAVANPPTAQPASIKIELPPEGTVQGAGGGGGGGGNTERLIEAVAAGVEAAAKNMVEDPASDGEVPGGEDVTEEAPKRRRRTKAEMEAARATGAVPASPAAATVTAPSAPAPIEPAPVGDKPDDQYTVDDLRGAFTAVFVHPDAEARILQILPSYGISKVRDASPEQYGPLTRAFEKLRRELLPAG